MFVRHPMRRALSSYVDKMIVSPKVKLNQFRAHVHVKGREIIRKRQSEASQNDSSSETEVLRLIRTDGYTNRSIFWTYRRILITIRKRWPQPKYSFLLLKSSSSSSLRQICKACSTIKNNIDNNLEWLVLSFAGHGFASHWVPYHRYCSPCSVWCITNVPYSTWTWKVTWFL